uniref:Serine aminopeptidase S33 domain-containing protein n=1 Tax=Aureoumbra lagunensis TaxID=44058 RepID=A0A7S3NJT4_9STRA
MPGLALVSDWRVEPAPDLFYVSLGNVNGISTLIKVKAPNCTSAMEIAAREIAAVASPTEKEQFETSMRWSGSTRWRVCSLKNQRIIVALVVDWRYKNGQVKWLAERVETMCGPMIEAGTHEHLETARSMLEREIALANQRRLGLLEPIHEASICVCCGTTLGVLLRTNIAQEEQKCLPQAVNCGTCGDVVCEECCLSDEDAPRLLKCRDCEHCSLSGKRLLRLQPPSSAEIAIHFALGALFEERAGADGTIDERAFLDLCRAVSRHPLIVDKRSLERESRLASLINGSKVPAIDFSELARRFKSKRKLALDLEEARQTLLDACVPAWSETALKSTINHHNSDTDEDKEQVQQEKTSWNPPHLLSSPLSAWLGLTNPNQASANARTGWGSIASRQGISKRRVWLELRDSCPRVLRLAENAAVPARPFVYLTSCRQIRREQSCLIELRLVPGTEMRSVCLKFETPSLTSGWWKSLCSARAKAWLEPQELPEDYYLMGQGTFNWAVSDGPHKWLHNMTRFFACGADTCTPLVGTNGVGMLRADGISYEGPERPFVALDSERRTNTKKQQRDKLVRRYRGVVAERKSKEDNESKQDARYANAQRESLMNDFESDDSEDEDEMLVSPRLEVSDSLPERGFGLAGSEVKAAYQALVKVIIRPPRATFDERRLGARDFGIRPPRLPMSRPLSWGQTLTGGENKVTEPPVVVHRDDFTVSNERGLEVKYSLWLPRQSSKEVKQDLPPCVVYVHGNACSRLGSLSLLRPLALGGVALCALDCAGSGNSGGEFVSLGHYERDDVCAVVDDMRKRQLVGRIAIWGRSMGAATALLYASTRDPYVAAVVADSPYSSLVELCRELVAKARTSSRNQQQRGSTNTSDASPQDAQSPGRNLFLGAITEAALALVRSSVRHRAGFDIHDVSPIAHVANMRHSATPVLFMHGANDDFVAPTHSSRLHHAHGGDATIKLLACDHQAARPATAIIDACLFLYDRLAPTSDRPRYNALLNKLADDGYLGVRDHNQQSKNSTSTPSAAQTNIGDDASGMDRSRQIQIEYVLYCLLFS